MPVIVQRIAIASGDFVNGREDIIVEELKPAGISFGIAIPSPPYAANTPPPFESPTHIINSVWWTPFQGMGGLARGFRWIHARRSLLGIGDTPRSAGIDQVNVIAQPSRRGGRGAILVYTDFSEYPAPTSSAATVNLKAPQAFQTYGNFNNAPTTYNLPLGGPRNVGLAYYFEVTDATGLTIDTKPRDRIVARNDKTGRARMMGKTLTSTTAHTTLIVTCDKDHEWSIESVTGGITDGTNTLQGGLWSLA